MGIPAILSVLVLFYNCFKGDLGKFTFNFNDCSNIGITNKWFADTGKQS